MPAGYCEDCGKYYDLKKPSQVMKETQWSVGTVYSAPWLTKARVRTGGCVRFKECCVAKVLNQDRRLAEKAAS